MKSHHLKGAEFTATLISSKGTEHEFSRKCTAPTDENGYCIIEDLPYGEYIIEETTVPDTTLKCSDFKLFVEKIRRASRKKISNDRRRVCRPRKYIRRCSERLARSEMDIWKTSQKQCKIKIRKGRCK